MIYSYIFKTSNILIQDNNVSIINYNKIFLVHKKNLLLMYYSVYYNLRGITIIFELSDMAIVKFLCT